MRIVHDEGQLREAMDELAGHGSLGREGGLSADRPVLIDRFLDDAVEVDVDAVRDHAGEVLIGGVMEHVEEAGVHSGDSACAIPPPSLLPWVIEVIKAYTAAIAARLDVRGLLNVQYAVRGTTVFVIEANPRASRTVPFVAKATGVPLAKVATRVMLGATLAELRDEGLLRPSVLDGDDGTATVAVKEAVLPFSRFPDVDPALGPEMRSTGEVMGIDATFGRAFHKAELAAGTVLEPHGTVFLSLADPRQAGGAGRRQAPASARHGHRRHQRHRRLPRRIRRAGRRRRGQGLGGDRRRRGEDRRRPDRLWQRDVRRQHAAGQRRPLRRRGDPQGRRGAQRGVCDDDQCRPRCRAGPRRAASVNRCRSARCRSCMGAEPVIIGSVTLKNPVMTASGTAGYGIELAASFDLAELGAVVVKSLAAFEWAGNPAPRLRPTPAGMLNSVGLQGPGIAHWLEHVLPDLLRTGATVVASVWGRTVDEYRAAGELLAGAPEGVVAVEINLSCPNVSSGTAQTRCTAPGSSPTIRRLSAEVVDAVAGAAGRPVWAKLSPNTDRVVEVAAAVRDAGAEAVTCINTLLGLAYDPTTRAPALGGGGGGLSGPAIHPVAVRIVGDVAAALPGFPVIGVGGIATSWDAEEFLLAGAVAVQVGTATFQDPRAPIRVLGEPEHTFVNLRAYPQFTASAALACPAWQHLRH